MVILPVQDGPDGLMQIAEGEGVPSTFEDGPDEFRGGGSGLPDRHRPGPGGPHRQAERSREERSARSICGLTGFGSRTGLTGFGSRTIAGT